MEGEGGGCEPPLSLVTVPPEHPPADFDVSAAMDEEAKKMKDFIHGQKEIDRGGDDDEGDASGGSESSESEDDENLLGDGDSDDDGAKKRKSSGGGGSAAKQAKFMDKRGTPGKSPGGGRGGRGDGRHATRPAVGAVDGAEGRLVGSGSERAGGGVSHDAARVCDVVLPLGVRRGGRREGI